jgi:hypothetical protein
LAALLAAGITDVAICWIVAYPAPVMPRPATPNMRTPVAEGRSSGVSP